MSLLKHDTTPIQSIDKEKGDTSTLTVKQRLTPEQRLALESLSPEDQAFFEESAEIRPEYMLETFWTFYEQAKMMENF